MHAGCFSGFRRGFLAGAFVYGPRSCIIYRRFSRESPKRKARTRAVPSQRRARTKRRIRVYASTTSLLLLLPWCAVTKGEKEGETGKERGTRPKLCSALEQFLDAYCHALLSPESTGHYQPGRESTLMRRLKSTDRRCGW